MIQNDWGVSGTYLLCKGNRIHKFRIKWCSKSKPTVEQKHELMRITEDIVKSNNLPRRITTGQLKITTKISLWSPRSKALSLRQFRSEKQGHLSAHKHSYVLRVSLADSKEQEEGLEHLPTLPSTPSKDGWQNALQPLNTEKKIFETASNDTEFVRVDGMQLNTKDTGAVIHEDKPACQNQANTKESVEVKLHSYEGEQHFARTSETEDIVSRLEKLVESVCMAARVCQNRAEVVGHDSEQHASETVTHGMKTEVVDHNATSSRVELRHDLESGPKENVWQKHSFPITEAETVCQNESTFTHERWVKHPSSPKEPAAAHMQVATANWKPGNTKVSTNGNWERFDTSKAAMQTQCSACKHPGDNEGENVVASPEVCEIPLTVSCYSTLTHSTVAQSYDTRRCGRITAGVAVGRKRRQSRNESDICELPKKKRVFGGGISPIVLGPTTFQEFSPYHKGVMSVYRALKTFRNILGRAEGGNGIESNITILDGKLENWLRYQSIISRLRAVSRVNSDKDLREILRYVIRNLRNRSANLAFVLQNQKFSSFTPTLWMNDTGPHIKRALKMRSEEKEMEMLDVSKESWQSTLHKSGPDYYKSSSAIHTKVGPIGAENGQPMDGETTEKLRDTVKGSNNLFKCIAISEHLPEDKDKYEVETNGVVQILNFGDDCSSIVKPRCSSVEEDHLVGAERPLHIHYDEFCIPNVSYYRSPPFSATNSENQKENIGDSSGDNALATAVAGSTQLQINNAEHSLTESNPSGIADTSPEQILLNAAMKLSSLKELHTIPSIRALRTTLIQQGVHKAIERTKLPSSVHPNCAVPAPSRDVSAQDFNSRLNNTHDAPSKLRSRTHTSSNFTTLDRVQGSFNTNLLFTSNTAESPVIEGSANNDRSTINCSQNCRPRRRHRKTSSKKAVPPHPDAPSVSRKAIVTAKPVRVNVGKLLSCSKMQVFFTTELNVDAGCPLRLNDCELHSMSLKSQASSNGEGGLITSLLHLMAFKASRNACSTSGSQSSMANKSLKHKTSERNRRRAESPNGCLINSSKNSQSLAYNFLKCTCSSGEAAESMSPTVPHCRCPPAVKFQGASARYTTMSSYTKRTTPRRQLIHMIRNIKSNVKDGRNICARQHCFYFHVDREESVEGFYSTVEKYCSALSKFHSQQYCSSRSIEILLRDIWLPGHKHSISFYVNLPLQKCKCSYCGLDKPAELCLNCGELFERTELGNYVPFNTQKTPERVDKKIDKKTCDAAVEVLNLVNDLYLCKPVVVVQKTDISVIKTRLRRRRKSNNICCNV